MSKKNGPRSFADLFAEAEKRPEYWTAGLEIEFTEELCRVMEERGISRAELARRAGTSAAYVTKVLRGSTNFTLATMAKLARALGMEVRLHLALRGSRTVWKDVLSAPESWPEGSPAVRQRVRPERKSGREPVWTAGGAGVPPAHTWTASSSATWALKGDQDEGSADQVA